MLYAIAMGQIMRQTVARLAKIGFIVSEIFLMLDFGVLAWHFLFRWLYPLRMRRIIAICFRVKTVQTFGFVVIDLPIQHPKSTLVTFHPWIAKRFWPSKGVPLLNPKPEVDLRLYGRRFEISICRSQYCYKVNGYSYPKPSILQTTLAASSLKKSLHTVPQIPLWSTSRRPCLLEPPTSLTEYNSDNIIYWWW